MDDNIEGLVDGKVLLYTSGDDDTPPVMSFKMKTTSELTAVSSQVFTNS
jgi:hypothetical protein